jgi:hypothetical protein
MYSREFECIGVATRLTAPKDLCWCGGHLVVCDSGASGGGNVELLDPATGRLLSVLLNDRETVPRKALVCSRINAAENRSAVRMVQARMGGGLRARFKRARGVLRPRGARALR